MTQPTPTALSTPLRLAIPIMMTMWALGLAFKAWMVPNTSFHWDEFWYLTQVHTLLRGELASGFQFVHGMFFAWIPAMGDEIAQLRTARWIAWGLMALSSVLLYMLARRWCSPLAAILAPVVYLSMEPVLIHGASFRSDSLISPLLLGALFLLSSPGVPRRHAIIAGFLWGAATAITIKSIFLAPVAAAILWMTVRPLSRTSFTVIMRTIAVVGLSALVSLFTLWLLQHALFNLAHDAPNQAIKVASGAGQKVFSQWWPGLAGAKNHVDTDTTAWIIILLGFCVCLVRRLPLAGLALSLLPIVFYRNTFSYYYIIMLAPASVMASILLQSLLDRPGFRGKSLLLPMALFALYVQMGLNIFHVSGSTHQDQQAAVIAAVHQIFPEPVPYIDHSGVVASFPKANGFLSTWGIENYQSAGEPFMPGLLASVHPPLLLADRNVLTPGSSRHDMLLPADRKLLAASYVNYWGPVWVAGVRLPPSGRTRLPFPGRYRLEGGGAKIDGNAYMPGDVITASPAALHSGFSVSHDHPDQSHPRLVWAAARPAPPSAPPNVFYRILN